MIQKYSSIVNKNLGASKLFLGSGVQALFLAVFVLGKHGDDLLASTSLNKITKTDLKSTFQ